jgi:hypothetical protein
MTKQINLILLIISLVSLLIEMTATNMPIVQVMAQTKEQQPITLSVKDITVKKSTNGTVADIQTAFSAHNPTKGTIIIEEIHYNLLLDGIRIVSGNIGERLEGFLASSATIFPIVGGSDLILKDKQTVQKNSVSQGIWNKMTENKSNTVKSEYLITGTITYKQGSVLGTSGTENDFKLTFP